MTFDDRQAAGGWDERAQSCQSPNCPWVRLRIPAVDVGADVWLGSRLFIGTLGSEDLCCATH